MFNATPQQFNCIIIDDEPLAHEVLVNHIAHVPFLNLTGQCYSAVEAFEMLHRLSIDLIFLDINMPVVNGLNFLKSLSNPPSVIFTTAYTEYALESYELNVLDYLLKPISIERFLKAVNKLTLSNNEASKYIQPQNTVTTKATGNRKYVFLKADGKLVKVNFDDIVYIEGMKDYLKIYMNEGTIVTHSTMKGMEETLPEPTFMRVHKSFIINTNAIKAIEGNIIYMDKIKVEIPLSVSYKEILLNMIAGK